MPRILGPEDPWATCPQRAARKIVRGTLELLAVLALFVGLPAAWLVASEFRLQAIERAYHATLRPLVARHAAAEEIEAALNPLDPHVFRTSDPPALNIRDRREFAFVLSTAYANVTVLLDPQDRAMAYRVERSGTAL